MVAPMASASLTTSRAEVEARCRKTTRRMAVLAPLRGCLFSAELYAMTDPCQVAWPVAHFPRAPNGPVTWGGTMDQRGHAKGIRLLALANAGIFTVLSIGSGCSTGNLQTGRYSTDDLLHHGEQILIGRCMRAHGFDYAVGETPAQVAKIDNPTMYPYGIDDVAWAGKHGFVDRTSNRPGDTPAEINGRYVRDLSAQEQAAYSLALFGPRKPAVSVRLVDGKTVYAGTKGCTARAERELYGDFAAWFRASTIVDNLSLEIQPKVRSHVRYIKALRKWARCMTRLRAPADDPHHLREKFAKRSESMTRPAAQRLERQIAVKEARCVRESALAATGQRLEKHYTEIVRNRHRSDLEAVQRMRTHALKRQEEMGLTEF